MLIETDYAILVIYYKAHHNVDPRRYRPAMSVRDAGKLMTDFGLPPITGSAVHQRIEKTLIPGGYMEQTDSNKTCPFFVTEKGEQYVQSHYDPQYPLGA